MFHLLVTLVASLAGKKALRHPEWSYRHRNGHSEEGRTSYVVGLADKNVDFERGCSLYGVILAEAFEEGL